MHSGVDRLSLVRHDLRNYTYVIIQVEVPVSVTMQYTRGSSYYRSPKSACGVVQRGEIDQLSMVSREKGVHVHKTILIRKCTTYVGSSPRHTTQGLRPFQALIYQHPTSNVSLPYEENLTVSDKRPRVPDRCRTWIYMFGLSASSKRCTRRNLAKTPAEIDKFPSSDGCHQRSPPKAPML
jgi:hypothetical protein